MNATEQVLNEHVAMKLTLQAIRRMYHNKVMRKMIDDALDGDVNEYVKRTLNAKEFGHG